MQSNTVDVFTIGFTQSNAERFFNRLEKAGVRTVIDVRLHNTSQLAAFAKADDLAFFLQKINNIRYVHQPLLAPTDAMLKAYKKEKGDWGVYEGRFLDLMGERKIEQRLKPEMFEGACLLCSEALPHHCHRRLVCEYLNDKWNGALSVRHL
ncbi:DUF488 domain-containing protein [Bradyrhizobium sp. DASA03120]|uniref:DUF488 domain-containing protein n=1 Tax=Bradyrhizobium sp. SMVTL-02 TaxID=3395917 RepID=UPI003F72EBEA